jgi:Zn-finger nucleic acid-binding protein
MLNCPNCKNPLKGANYKGVRVDECENCRGIWFDKDELVAAKDNTDSYLRWLDIVIFEDKPSKYAAAPSSKQCPKCEKNLGSHTLMHSKVAIDACPQCKGVWLDDQEFEKIIAYLENYIENETASEYARDVLKELLEIGTGDKDKISEIKDFLAVLKLFEIRLAAEHPKIYELLQNINIYYPVR